MLLFTLIWVSALAEAANDTCVVPDEARFNIKLGGTAMLGESVVATCDDGYHFAPSGAGGTTTSPTFTLLARCRCDQSARRFGGRVAGLAACEQKCIDSGCAQIDFNDNTWCNTYDTACTPDADCGANVWNAYNILQILQRTQTFECVAVPNSTDVVWNTIVDEATCVLTPCDTWASPSDSVGLELVSGCEGGECEMKCSDGYSVDGLSTNPVPTPIPCNPVVNTTTRRYNTDTLPCVILHCPALNLSALGLYMHRAPPQDPSRVWLGAVDAEHLNITGVLQPVDTWSYVGANVGLACPEGSFFAETHTRTLALACDTTVQWRPVIPTDLPWTPTVAVDDTWSVTGWGANACVKATCDVPPVPANAHVESCIVDGTQGESECDMQCNDGYRHIGGNVRAECTAVTPNGYEGGCADSIRSADCPSPACIWYDGSCHESMWKYEDKYPYKDGKVFCIVEGNCIKDTDVTIARGNDEWDRGQFCTFELLHSSIVTREYFRIKSGYKKKRNGYLEYPLTRDPDCPIEYLQIRSSGTRTRYCNSFPETMTIEGMAEFNYNTDVYSTGPFYNFKLCATRSEIPVPAHAVYSFDTVCERATCADPNLRSFGLNYTELPLRVLGQTLQLRCPDGMAFSDSGDATVTLTCTAVNGTDTAAFAPELPSDGGCVASLCPPPSLEGEGQTRYQANCTTTLMGGSCEVTCAEGFELTPETVTTAVACTARAGRKDSEFVKASYPICTKHCDIEREAWGMTYADNTVCEGRHGDVCTMRCKDGYVASSSNPAWSGVTEDLMCQAETYTRVPNIRIADNNFATSAHHSLEECQRVCSSDRKCKYFQYEMATNATVDNCKIMYDAISSVLSSNGTDVYYRGGRTPEYNADDAKSSFLQGSLVCTPATCGPPPTRTHVQAYGTTTSPTFTLGPTFTRLAGCRCDESARRFGGRVAGLAACEQKCIASSCAQIDFNDNTWCNTYDTVCTPDAGCGTVWNAYTRATATSDPPTADSFDTAEIGQVLTAQCDFRYEAEDALEQITCSVVPGSDRAEWVVTNNGSCIPAVCGAFPLSIDNTVIAAVPTIKQGCEEGGVVGVSTCQLGCKVGYNASHRHAVTCSYETAESSKPTYRPDMTCVETTCTSMNHSLGDAIVAQYQAHAGASPLLQCPEGYWLDIGDGIYKNSMESWGAKKSLRYDCLDGVFQPRGKDLDCKPKLCSMRSYGSNSANCFGKGFQSNDERECRTSCTEVYCCDYNPLSLYDVCLHFTSTPPISKQSSCGPGLECKYTNPLGRCEIDSYHSGRLYKDDVCQNSTAAEDYNLYRELRCVDGLVCATMPTFDEGVKKCIMVTPATSTNSTSATPELSDACVSKIRLLVNNSTASAACQLALDTSLDSNRFEADCVCLSAFTAYATAAPSECTSDDEAAIAVHIVACEGGKDGNVNEGTAAAANTMLVLVLAVFSLRV